MLVVITTTVEPLVRLAQWILTIHSESNDLKQRAEHCQGRQDKTVGMALWEGDGYEAFRRHIRELMWNEEPWLPLTLDKRSFKLRGLASITLARAYGAIKQLVIDDVGRGSHVLDNLLLHPTHEVAQGILDTRPCRTNHLLERFVARFSTKEQLVSHDCLGTAWFISWLQRRSTMATESKMALMRAITNQRAQTWKKSFVDVNSEWAILQNRTCECSAALRVPRGRRFERCVCARMAALRVDAREAEVCTAALWVIS